VHQYLNKDLEIIVITYNRCTYLRNTLEQLQLSDFRNCKITVLDNCSTDATSEVLECYREKLPCLNIIRHPRNINGNPNIVRAYEMATMPYLWLLGDDDIINPAYAQAVLDICSEAKADLINLWRAPLRPEQATGLHRVRDFIRSQRFVVFDQSFISGVITKTALITDASLSKAYDLIASSYPQLVFTAQALDSDGYIYIMPSAVVERSGEDFDKFGLKHQMNIVWYVWWCKICSVFRDESIRQKVMDDGFQQITFRQFIISNLIDYRLRRNLLTIHKYLEIMSYQPKRRLIFCFFAALIYILPKPLVGLMRSASH
jgi:glycosyltransferase involved in cell wall biosynthesis